MATDTGVDRTAAIGAGSIPGLPTWTWGVLELVMRSLAANSTSRAMVSHLVEAARQKAPFIPEPEVRREIAMIFAAIVDPSFP